MKSFIKSTVILSAFVLLATGAFAAKKVKPDTLNTEIKAWASVNYYANNCGLEVAIQSATPGDATLTIYDGDGNVVMKDAIIINADTIQKSYLLTDVTDGDYTIEVTSNNNVIEKTIALSSTESEDQVYAL
jgi:hypothetical protein